MSKCKKYFITLVSILLVVGLALPTVIHALSIQNLSEDIVNSKKLRGDARGYYYTYADGNSTTGKSTVAHDGTTHWDTDYIEIGSSNGSAYLWVPEWGWYENERVGMLLKSTNINTAGTGLGSLCRVEEIGTVSFYDGGAANSIKKNEVTFYKNVNTSQNRANGTKINLSSELGQTYLSSEQGDGAADYMTESVDSTREVVGYPSSSGNVYIGRGQANLVEEFTLSGITFLRTKRGDNASFNAVRGYNNTDSITFYTTVWQTGWAAQGEPSETWGFNLWQGGVRPLTLTIDLNDGDSNTKATISPNKLFYEGLAGSTIATIANAGQPSRGPEYVFTGWEVVSGDGTIINNADGSKGFKFNTTDTVIKANWLHVGYAKVQYFDQDQKNVLLDEKTGISGVHNSLIADAYTNRTTDLNWYKDRGYEVATDGFDSNPKFVAGQTTTIEIYLKHTYTTVNKRTYEKDKCLNKACSTVQPEKGC